MTTCRVPYEVAGRAMRQAIRRARELRLADGQWRVFLAVLTLTGTYSKLDDWTYVSVIADEAGVSTKHCGRTLAMLAREGIIGWNPRRGQSVKSHVWLPEEGKTGHVGGLVSGAADADVLRKNRTDGAEKQDGSDAETRQPEVPLPRRTEEDREETTFGARDARAFCVDECYECDETGSTKTPHDRNGRCIPCQEREPVASPSQPEAGSTS